jgi:hypothetical protein
MQDDESSSAVNEKLASSGSDYDDESSDKSETSDVIGKKKK